MDAKTNSVQSTTKPNDNGDAWKYALAYLLHASVLVGYTLPHKYAVFMTIIYVYIIVPVLDTIIETIQARRFRDSCLETSRLFHNRQQQQQYQQQEQKDIHHDEHSVIHRVIVWIWLPIQVALNLYILTTLPYPAFSFQWTGLVMAMGTVGAGGINVSHELFHKSSVVERAMGRILLALACYGHFEVEHTLGHHRNVGTDQDPATAKLGESFYHFLPKTVVGGFLSSWKLEWRRIMNTSVAQAKKDKPTRNPLWLLFVEHRCFQALIYSFFIISSIYVFLGTQALVFYIFQTLMSIFWLEKINYIEHYGLRRHLLSDGSVEPVGPYHSWDAPQTLSNYLLFKLQRHADHHLHATKRYHCLDTNVYAPRLPAGYPSLALIVMVPWAWRRIMDPRVRACDAERALVREQWAKECKMPLCLATGTAVE